MNKRAICFKEEEVYSTYTRLKVAKRGQLGNSLFDLLEDTCDVDKRL